MKSGYIARFATLGLVFQVSDGDDFVCLAFCISTNWIPMTLLGVLHIVSIIITFFSTCGACLEVSV